MTTRLRRMVVALVERAAELATVRSVLATGGGAVLVTGPAGVGKSRLLREALGTTPVATARASPVAPVPFGVVSDLLPALGAGEGDRAATIRRYVAGLRTLPYQTLVIEDLHWADADSLAVVVDFVRAGDGPVLLASTRDEPHRPLVDTLATLTGTPDVTMLHLTGLSTGGVVALIEAVWGAPVPPRVAMQIRRRTDGLPYWVEELARSAGDPITLAKAALPGMAAAALCARVDAAGPAARRVAEIAAVLGEQVDLDLLAAVLARPVAALLPPLRELVDAWILVEVAPDQFGFRHALTREAVADRVPDAQCREWRGRAFAAMQAAGASAAVLAWHAAGAGRRDEAAGLAERAAAATLASGSGAEALRLAELALECGAEPAWPVHGVAARAAYEAGWFGEAEAHARAWREGAEATGSVEIVAEADCLRASLRWRAGDLAGQWAVLEAALARPGLAGRALARVRAARVRALHRAERLVEAVAEADQVLVLAAQVGDRAARRSALVDKGTALAGTSRGLAGQQPDEAHQAALRAEGLALLAQAEQECLAAGDRVTLGRVLNNRLVATLAAEPMGRRWAHWEATLAQATALDLQPSLGKIVRQGVDLAYITGDWQRGWSVVTSRLPEETDPVERVVLAAKAALLALEADRIEDGVRLTERSIAGAAGMDQFWAVLYVALAQVAVAARTGSPAQVARALRGYRLAVTPTAHADRPYRAVEAAWWAVRGGVSPEAVRAFLTATVPAEVGGCVGDEIALSLAADAPAIQAGERLLDRELGAVRRADVLIRLAGRRLRGGESTLAASYAAEASRLLARWPGIRRAAAQELAQAVAAHVPALTAREREVWELVAAGLSNREIGDRLQISPRTVAVHVSRLLAKAGCGSRTELAVRRLRSVPG